MDPQPCTKTKFENLIFDCIISNKMPYTDQVTEIVPYIIPVFTIRHMTNYTC